MKTINTFVNGKIVTMTEVEYELHLDHQRSLPPTHDEGIARTLEAWGTNV